MRSKHQFIVTKRQKIILGIIGAYVAWQIIVRTALVDAIFEFCLAGVIPGTGIMLSPDTIIWSVVGILSFGSVAIIHRHIRAAMRHRVANREANRPQLVMPALNRPSAPAKKQQPAVVLRIKKPRTARSSKHTGVILDALAKGYVGIVTAVQVTSATLSSLLVPLAHTATTAIRTVYVYICFAIALLWTIAVYYAKQAWYWAEPHLWRLDGWLEKQTHRALAWTTKKATSYEATTIIIDMFRETKKQTGKLHPKQWWNQAKQQTRKIRKLKDNLSQVRLRP